MINSMTVINYLGESITLELGFPEKSGFLIQKIEGLVPGKATINTSTLAGSDGSIYNSAVLPERNIVISLKYLFKPTIETVRQLSYKYFPIKKWVTLVFETDNRLCEISGVVESNEPDIFSKEESAQISIICPDPYFYSIEQNLTVFCGIADNFQFEFANESLTEDVIEFGIISTDTEQTIYYSGDADVGVTITIHALGEVKNITIYNTGTRESMKIDTDKLTTLTGSDIVARDDIIISTIRGNKSITLLRDGVYTNILNCLDRDSDWFRLAKGDNIFAYTAEYGLTNLQFQVENRIAYEGI